MWALTHFPIETACTRLAAISRHARNPMVDETINAALDALSQRVGLPRHQMEELSIPTFGIGPDATRRQEIGPCTAMVDITSGEPVLRWMKGGKPRKSLPSAVAKAHPEQVTQLKRDVKNLGKLLLSQRDRLDQLMAEPRTWPFGHWRKYYLDHPLVGVFARRLIWTIGTVQVLFQAGKPMDIHGDDRAFDDQSEVRLWHPIDATSDQVSAWRQWIMDLEIQQPFKQAFREIYRVGDQERHATASQQFAGTVVRQATLRTLAQRRGWKIGYFGGWDTGGSESERQLPDWGLRVLCNMGDPPPNSPMLPSGGLVLLSLGQVSFRPLTQEHAARYGVTDVNAAVPLERIPPLIFSEVMRDLSLFAAAGAPTEAIKA